MGESADENKRRLREQEKLQRTREGELAMREYQKQHAVTLANTARLRELRLEQEARIAAEERSQTGGGAKAKRRRAG